MCLKNVLKCNAELRGVLKGGGRGDGLCFQSRETILAIAFIQDMDASYFLGVFYENGFVVDKNERKAAELYRKASSAGHHEAQKSLSRFFLLDMEGKPMLF